MRKLGKIIDIMQLALNLIWYCSILALYVFSLIQASSLELPVLIGIVLTLWPLILVLSVQMAKESVLASLPPLTERQIDGWGALTVPKVWQIENGNVLACRNQTSSLCAILYRSNQIQTSATFTLPDHTTVTIQIPQKAISAELVGVFRCHYTIGKQRGKGYISLAQSAGVFFVAVILYKHNMGKYIAERILDEI